ILVANDPQPYFKQASTKVHVIQISNTLEHVVHEGIFQNLLNNQEVDIEVVSPQIEVVDRIQEGSHDVGNNENIDSSSRIMYAEIVNDTPSWVYFEVKKRKRVVKPIDIDFDALFKLLNVAIPKKSKVVSRIMVDNDGNKFAYLSIPQVEKERNAMTPADYEVSRLGLGRSTLECDMAMARDSIDSMLKRLEKYKSQNTQLKAEKNQLVEY
ncbi:hypothetical protein KI387_030298, partial [Taxus chinensis]